MDATLRYQDLHEGPSRRVTVMGLGRFGGGEAVTRWLLERGHCVTLTDTQTQEPLRQTLDRLRASESKGELRLALGGHREPDFTDADLVVVNPAVPRPWANPLLTAARKAGVPLTTEIRLGIESLPAGVRTVGVTGTAGKSTTTMMLSDGLRAALGERVRTAGNIGASLLDPEARVRPGDVVVLELSSAQLHWLAQEPAWKPELAVVTNLVPNHIDWHGDFDHYRLSKASIVGPRLVCHPGPIEAWSLHETEVRTVGSADTEAFQTGMRLPGAHNASNAALAYAASRWALDVLGEPRADDEITGAIRACAGLPSRLCTVGYARGVRIVDDSKCTTPEGTVLALGAFTGARVWLIAGGADKGVDLSPIAHAAVGAEDATVLCVGATGPTIARGVRSAGGRAAESGTVESAVEHATSRMQAGDILLLSPGCASWDQFANYEERSSRFLEAVKTHLGPIQATQTENEK